MNTEEIDEWSSSARDAFARGEFAELHEQLAAIVPFRQDDPELFALLAFAGWMIAADPGPAEAVMTQLRHAWHTSASGDALAAIGFVHLEIGDLRSAKATFRKALELDASSAPAVRGMRMCIAAESPPPNLPSSPAGNVALKLVQDAEDEPGRRRR